MKRRSYFSGFVGALMAGIILLTQSISAWAARGDPDVSFGTLSNFTDVVSSKQMYPGAIAVQADGKLLVAGSMAQTAAPGTYILLLRRYNANGSVDTSFGLSGFAIERILGTPYVYGYANSVAVQTDGKIVVAGGYYSSANQLAPAIFRFTARGELDTTFGTDGRWALPLGTGGAWNITIFKNRILALLDADLVALRSLDGSLDTSFGAGGFAHLGIIPRALAVNLKRDMLVVGGNSIYADGAGLTFPRLQYFKSDGTPDMNHGAGGIVSLDFAAPECLQDVNAVYSLDTQGGDGKVLVVAANYAITVLFNQANVFRLRTDDSLDAFFGTGGFVARCVFGGTSPPSGRIRVYGSSQIVALINRAGGSVTARNLKHYDTSGVFTFDSPVYQAADFVILPTSEKVVTVERFSSGNIYGIKLRRFLN